MNKVLIVSNFYYPHIGGIEQTAHDCVEALKSQYEVKVICFNDRNNDSVEMIDGVEIIKCAANIKISSQVLSATFSRNLKNLLKTFRPDVVIFNYPNPFAAHYTLRHIEGTTQLILYWHSDIVKQKVLRALFVNQNHSLLKRAARIISTSPNYILGSPYLSKYRDKCRVIPSCININRLALTQDEIQHASILKNKWDNRVICIAVGRHVEYKGFEYLIRASKLIKTNAIILLVGDGPLTDRLKQLSDNCTNIVFLGRLSDSELREYLSISDIYCFPSITKNEAFGLSLAEALYLGKPAVTFTIPGSGVNYVSIKDETGLEVENRNVQELAKAIDILADDPSLRVALGENAHKRASELFSFERFSNSIIEEVDYILHN